MENTKSYEDKHCQICNVVVNYYSWSKHKRGLTHINGGVRPKLSKIIHCEVCNKDISRHNWRVHKYTDIHMEAEKKLMIQ